MSVGSEQLTFAMPIAAPTVRHAEVYSGRPARRPDEILSAKARVRAQIWLLLIFGMLAVAGVTDWLYFQSRPAGVQFLDGNLQRFGIGWSVTNALLTTSMLAGLWNRERWLKGLFQTWLGMEVLASGVLGLSGAFFGAFPAILLVGMTLRLAALLIFTHKTVIRLFLSTAFMELYYA